jgi:colanic acid biosynthesis glycosyl transferase WcaI
MKVLILGINYAPELVGIGPYTAGMARFLAEAQHEVTVICAKPYYPAWKVDAAYAGGGPRYSHEDGVRVVRLPIYIPSKPDGKRRVLHHLSFSLRAEAALIAEARRCRPDVIIAIAPSLISTVAARSLATLTGAKLWLHIQDFEVEAAIATGLLEGRGKFAAAARSFERWALAADVVSTISPQMCNKLLEKGVSKNRVVEFRNWADVEDIYPLTKPSKYRDLWSIDRPHVAIYSGNIANKQGIEIVVKAARALAHRKDLMFVVCGNGPNRAQLVDQAEGMDNIQFHDLQPRASLAELLGLASVHLLPQIAGAADLVLPSKLTNMLASGRPIVATADANTGLAAEVDDCGLLTPPGDWMQFAHAIETLLNDPIRRRDMGNSARSRALSRWSRETILSDFNAKLCDLLSSKEGAAGAGR